MWIFEWWRLGCRPRVVERATFEYSPLGEALNNKIKSKIDRRNKVLNTDKQDKNSNYNP